MKKNELQSIIRECVKGVLDEVNYDTTKGGKPVFAVGAPGSQKRNTAIADPTKEEMLQFLKGQFGNEEGFEGDAEAAMYWFANFNHGGQWSNLYSVLSTSHFRPGPIARGPEKGSMEEMMYDALESEYGKGEVQEDGGAGAGAGAAGGQGGMGQPGTGMGNVTANVDPIRTPRAFKKNTNEAGDEDPNDPLYVEFVRERPGETPFMMGDQKFQYVTAKYPNGKEDIGVYAFAGDVVYGYNAFRQMHNIKEESQPSQESNTANSVLDIANQFKTGKKLITIIEDTPGKFSIVLSSSVQDLKNGSNNGSITFSLRQMIGASYSQNNVKEEEQPEAYDDKTDTMAPGPRSRPEDWETGGAAKPPTPVNELKFPIIKLKNILKKKKV